MTTGRIVGLIVIGCLGFWVAQSYRHHRAEPPLTDPFARGEWYFLASEFDAAAAAYKQAIVAGLEEPRKKDAYFKRARALHEAGKYKEAIDAYRVFMKLYPNSQEANRAQGEMEWIRQNKGIE